MQNFLEKVGRFFVNLLIVFLILLISFQIIIKNDAAHRELQRIENFVRGFFTDNPETVVVSKQKEATQRSARIVIDLMEDLSLPDVWVLINGERVANFAQGIVSVSAGDGDLISIDATDYDGVLWFELKYVSPDITTWELGEHFRTRGNIIGLGIVELSDKL